MEYFRKTGEKQKGGETMSLEAIKKLTEVEAASAQQLSDAQADAKRSVAGAESAGQAELAKAKAEANAEAKNMLIQAEARAAGEARSVQEQTAQSCEQLKAEARTKLDAAASLIVRRVVSN